MRKYKHLFFDLDHTLWDFATNEELTLSDLFRKFNLDGYFESFSEFFSIYEPINKELWLKYRNGEITKRLLTTERFHRTFLMKGLDSEPTAVKFGQDFVTLSATKTALMPHTIEVLDYLKKRYTLHIITNGFIETQYVKLRSTDLEKYFDKVFISEKVGAQKPKRAFFEYAVKSCNAKKDQSLVIGDNLEADIIGAKNFGLDHVFYNPLGIAHSEIVFKEIKSLKELIGWL